LWLAGVAIGKILTSKWIFDQRFDYLFEKNVPITIGRDHAIFSAIGGTSDQ